MLQREQTDLDQEMKTIQEKHIGNSTYINPKYIAPPEDRRLAVRHLKNRTELLKVVRAPCTHSRALVSVCVCVRAFAVHLQWSHFPDGALQAVTLYTHNWLSIRHEVSTR